MDRALAEAKEYDNRAQVKDCSVVLEFFSMIADGVPVEWYLVVMVSPVEPRPAGSVDGSCLPVSPWFVPMAPRTGP